MTGKIACAAVSVAILLGAAILRLANLDCRVMHGDEAVHAIKFGDLLERGGYRYDPHEYHGPSLNYLTLPVAWVTSAFRIAAVTEVHLRLVPAVFGIGLVALTWMMRGELGCGATWAAAALAAASPALVFFSRYYIQEMLLVFWTFAAMVALRRLGGAWPASGLQASRAGWVGARRVGWLMALGVSVGMMHAAKETCVIPLFAMAVASVPQAVAAIRRFPLVRLVGYCGLVLAVAFVVSGLFHSSFLHNLRGVLDSYATYFHYARQAGGQGSEGLHRHPWYYYFQVFFLWAQGGVVWSELPIGMLAVLGATVAIRPWGVCPSQVPITRFLLAYTCVTCAIYSLLPYKTPWCGLGFLHAMILLAGIGAAAWFRSARAFVGKGTAMVVLAGACTFLAWEAWRSSYVACEDPDNPYVYAHPTRDVLDLVQHIVRLADCQGQGQQLPIQVICVDDDYWPLPWYLRSFPNVGWFHRIPEGKPAPLIIVQPQMEPELIRFLYERQPPGERNLYVPATPAGQRRPWQLRPFVPLRPYVPLELWQSFLTGKQP